MHYPILKVANYVTADSPMGLLFAIIASLLMAAASDLSTYCWATDSECDLSVNSRGLREFL